MAFEGDQRRLLVETDFLFGLHRGDRLHEKVIRALEMHKSGVVEISVLSSAVLEAAAVLHSRGLSPQRIAEAFSLMDAKLIEYGVRSVLPTTLNNVVLAEQMRIQHGELTFFDSLHAATGRSSGLELLSSDEVYRRVGIAHLDLKQV